MVHRCVVCKSHDNPKTGDMTLSFHLFPKDVTLRKKWMDSLGLTIVSDWHRVCSKHFDFNNFKNINGYKRKLWPNAVPSLCTSQFETINDISFKYSQPHSSTIYTPIVPGTVNLNEDINVSCNYSQAQSSTSTPIVLDTIINPHEDIDVSCIYSQTQSSTICAPIIPDTINPEEEDNLSLLDNSFNKSFSDCSIIATPTKKRKTFDTTRIGDLSIGHFSTPRRAKKHLNVVKCTVSNLRLKNKLLNQKNKRLQRKVFSLNGLLNVLKNKNLVSEIAADNLKALGSDVLERLVKNGLSGKKQYYSKELKQFSVTLQYYSPKAYLYIRKTFNNLLPNPRTLRRWYMVVNGSPGFTMESFESISKMAKDRSICCNLVIDEMCIRRYVEIDSQRNIHGYINMGAEYSYDNDNIPLASNALVFLAVGINGYWKMPIAYFLIDGLNGKERANLLIKAIELLRETGVTLCSITFDGAKVNLKMCTEMGASFNIDSPKPFILNGVQDKLFCFFDPAHMLKLIRNAWNNSYY